MGPAIGSQMTLIDAVQGGLSTLCGKDVGGQAQRFWQWYAMRQSY